MVWLGLFAICRAGWGGFQFFNHLPLWLDVSPTLVFPVHSHGWVRHLHVCSPPCFYFNGEGDACFCIASKLSLCLLLVLQRMSLLRYPSCTVCSLINISRFEIYSKQKMLMRNKQGIWWESPMKSFFFFFLQILFFRKNRMTLWLLIFSWSTKEVIAFPVTFRQKFNCNPKWWRKVPVECLFHSQTEVNREFNVFIISK